MANINDAFTVDALSIQDKVGFFYGISDPTDGGGETAPKGSIYIQVPASGEPKQWFKYGDSNTDWQKKAEKSYINPSGAPTVNNDGVDTAAIGKAFDQGDTWIDENTGLAYMCIDNSTGAAVWDTINTGGLPGGADTQVQFNDGGSFGGDPDFTFDKTTNTLGIDLLQLKTGLSNPSHSEGLLFYDNTFKCPAFYNDRTAVTNQLGRELWTRAYNNSGDPITNGEVVLINGWDTDFPTIRLATNTDISDAESVIGFATETIANGTSGEVTRFGLVNNLNTLGETSGSPVFLGVDGAWTTTRPEPPDYVVRLGTIGRVSDTIGSINSDIVGFNETDTDVNMDGALNGLTVQKQSIAVVVDTGVVYVEIDNENDPTKDLPFILDGKRYLLNTTTGAGTGGKARAALTAGTINSPQINFVYIYLNGGVPTLATSPTYPLIDFAWIGVITLLDVTSTDNDGPLVVQRTNNAVDNGEADGIFNYMTVKLRQLGASYQSGIDPTVTITTQPLTIDNLTVATSFGQAFQLHIQNFVVQDGTEYYVINHPTEPFKKISDLNEIDVDANGDTLRSNNTRYGLTIIGAVGSINVADRLYVNLPNGSYGSDDACINDINNYAVTTVPSGSGLSTTAFRIARICVNYSTTSNGTFTNLLGAGEYQDERGQPLGTGGGGSGGLTSPLTTKGDLWGYDTANARIPVGADDQVLIADSTQALGVRWGAVAGTGDVVGPASATDNAVARYDGTTGKLIQDSNVTISDIGAVTIHNDLNIYGDADVANYPVIFGFADDDVDAWKGFFFDAQRTRNGGAVNVGDTILSFESKAYYDGALRKSALFNSTVEEVGTGIAKGQWNFGISLDGTNYVTFLNIKDSATTINGANEDHDVIAGKDTSGNWLFYDAGTDILDLDTVVDVNANYVQFSDMTAPGNPSDGQGRLYKKTGDDGLFWKPDSAGPEVDLTSGGGETNTASNQGTDGVGVYDTKVGVDLQFRHVAPGSNKVTTTLNIKDIDIDIVEANIDHDQLLNFEANEHLDWTLDQDPTDIHANNIPDGADATAIHDNIASEISAITLKGTPASGDFLLIEDSADSNNKKRITVGTLPTGGGGEANTASNQGTDGVGVYDTKVGVDLQFRHIAPASDRISVVLNGKDIDIDTFPSPPPFDADQLQNPNNADWAVNALAKASKDSNNNALVVRRFDDVTEQGVGLKVEIPTGATNIIIDLKSRPETGAATNLDVVPKLYVREIPDNAAVESWSAGTDMTTITMGTSNEFFQYDSQTIALSTLGLVAGRVAQFELTRNTGSGSDTLVGFWNLLQLGVRFT